jgi:hypothetical protein
LEVDCFLYFYPGKAYFFGWMPNYKKASDAQPALDKIGRYLAEAGREWGDVGLDPRLLFGDGDSERWAAEIAEWQAVGATHLSVNTMYAGFQTAGEHISAIGRFADLMDM